MVNLQAFQAAWAAACKVEASVIDVPAKHVFLVGPISFSGPYCQHDIVFQVIPYIDDRIQESHEFGPVHTIEDVSEFIEAHLFANFPQLDGKIVAPTGSSHWGSGLLQWLEFTKLVGLTIKGSGTIDGNGAVWWQSAPYDDDPLDDQAKLIFPSNGTFGQKPPIPVISLSTFQIPKLVFCACPNKNFMMQVRSSLGGKMPSIKPTVRTMQISWNSNFF